MLFYDPGNITEKAPLVVVLHGCTQMAKSCAEQSGWNKLAKFNLVVNTTPRNPLEDVVKNDELVSWMKEYPDAMDAINKIKDKK